MKFIDAKRAVAIHDLLISEYGGAGGARDMGLLESALARPVNIAAYEKDGTADVPRLAAAYAHGIVKNHPFLDGNKRTAAAVFELFLDMNGYELMADDVSTMNAVIALADGSLSERAFAAWIKDNIELEKLAPMPRGGPKANP
ncbi:MAG: type II toxin-antitoxin system death-on-curing family toxin [Beijerinckiaceae bacterium]